LARADIERRGDDAATVSKPSLFARLFGGKSNDDEDEGLAPTAQEKAAPAIQVADAKSSDARSSDAKSSDVRSSEQVPVPRGKPPGAIFQLAAADAQLVQPVRAKPATASDNTETKPQTPADIINARGFWGDMPAAPNQATPAQVAAANARQALASTDPQSTASVPAAYQAMAYAPEASSPVDRANIVAASAPIPRSVRSSNRNSMAANNLTTVIAKGNQGQSELVATSTRIAASNVNETWMRVLMLAPSASTSMSVTMLGDPNLTTMSVHFVKPHAAITMGFSDDPQPGGLSYDHFSGAAVANLPTQSFGLRTAALR
jgi:hypothetical protein